MRLSWAQLGHKSLGPTRSSHPPGLAAIVGSLGQVPFAQLGARHNSQTRTLAASGAAATARISSELTGLLPVPSGPAAWGAAEAVGSGRTRPQVTIARTGGRAGPAGPDRRQRLSGHDHHATTAV